MAGNRLTMRNKKRVVCLGGGIGTVNTIKGIKKYTNNITVVISMADEGGSAGRLRRLYNIFPPGDIISCMAAFIQDENPLLAEFLTYRFPGNRYSTDKSLGGHKLGNLIMAALQTKFTNIQEATRNFQKIFNIGGSFLPATDEQVFISAKTVEGKEIIGEENIDLGKYNGKRVLEEVFLHPKDAHCPQQVVSALEEADVIVAGPGDLYTTILPVLIVPKIRQMLETVSAFKVFVVNIANKPFETKGYTVGNYIAAVKKHLGYFPFQTVVANNNMKPKIPNPFRYSYVQIGKIGNTTAVIQKDLVEERFPLYHSSEKLAKTLFESL